MYRKIYDIKKGSTREPSMKNSRSRCSPGFGLKPKGTREPSTGRHSQCDPGLELLERSGGYRDCKGFRQQGHGGDWRLGAAVQQPSYGELRQPDKCTLSEFNIIDI